jgi:hypothetical protein
MSMMDDLRASFQKKGFKFVSLTESTADPEKSILTYTDGSGRTITKDVKIRLASLEDTMEAVDLMDPDDLANFLLG